LPFPKKGLPPPLELHFLQNHVFGPFSFFFFFPGTETLGSVCSKKVWESTFPPLLSQVWVPFFKGFFFTFFPPPRLASFFSSRFDPPVPSVPLGKDFCILVDPRPLKCRGRAHPSFSARLYCEGRESIPLFLLFFQPPPNLFFEPPL